MFSQVHTKTRNRLTYRKLNLIVYLRYNQKLKLRSIGRRSQEQLTDSFTPIDLNNIFDDNDPINLWLSEKEPPAFEEDEFPWLNVDEQEENDRINIDDDDDDRQLGVTPPFRYSVDQASEGTHNNGSGDDLTPLNSGDGSAGGGESGDGGDGGYGGAYHDGTSQSSRPSSRDINATLSDHNDRRSQEYEEEPIAHTFRRLRKAKDKSTRTQPHCADVGAHGYTDDQQMPPSFTMPAHCNWSCGSDSYDGGPYNYGYTGSLEPHLGASSYSSQPSYPGSEPHLSQFNPSSQNQDHFQIFNHGTINYGDHHYYRPTIHGGDSSSSGQSWRDATSSYFFDEQGTDTGYTADQSEDNNYQEPARRSFWW